MALSSKALVRELNVLQKNLDLYQAAVIEGKDVEFNKEQVQYYRGEVTRVRTAWLNSTETEEETTEAVSAPTPVVAGATSAKRTQTAAADAPF